MQNSVGIWEQNIQLILDKWLEDKYILNSVLEQS